ncbi:MAG: AAA family ATPase [Bacteroidales bacterium]|jgi:exodeoxyribonuclease-5|nr:AAA family ATPase [Bacteroidales bacterium]
MIKNHISKLLSQFLAFTPTRCQAKLIDGLSELIASDKNNQITLIKGYAGTGKTTIINALTKCLSNLNMRSVLMAPTGRAAKVIAKYTDLNAYTIHKVIYRQKSLTDGIGRFVINNNIHKNTYFIVDEASMISNESNENSIFGSGQLLDDLLKYVYSGKNCRLILIGDIAQLPPVGLSVSPALDANVLNSYGFPVWEYELKDVVRQKSDSGILTNATNIRNLISRNVLQPGFLSIQLVGFNDIEKLNGSDLIEKISTCYSKYGISETAVITRSNKRANIFNNGIRGSILFRENEIEKGDILTVVKNNYFWVGETEEFNFIANGDIAEIEKIYNYEELYGFRFANVCLRFVDYKNIEIDCKIFLETLSIEAASFSYERSRELFDAINEDYIDIPNKRERWKKINENPYFNALQVKYSYAVTCHKAQGGQWKAIFVDHGYISNDMLDTDYYRWLYTAFTRPEEKLFLVNFNNNFFEDSDNIK